MSEEKWKELVFEIGSSRLEGYFFDVGNQHKDTILWADFELTRLRAEVERLQEDLEICIDERNGRDDYIQKMKAELRRRDGRE